MTSRKTGQTVQSVERALAILETVAGHHEGITASEVAAIVDLRLPTTYHLLNTLVLGGYLCKYGRTYLIDSKVTELSRTAERNLRPDLATQAAMHSLAARTGETVYVSRWVRGDVMTVDVAEGTLAVRVGGVHVGTRGNANGRASGKVLLAFGPEGRRRAYLSGALERPTPQTITDPAELGAVLQQVRSLGHAVDEEEFVEDVCCLAAPCGEDLAIAVMMPAARFAEIHEAVLTDLLEATRSLGAAVPELDRTELDLA